MVGCVCMTRSYHLSCVVLMLTQRIHPTPAALCHPSGVLSQSHLCPFPLCRVPAFLMPCVRRTRTARKGKLWWLAMVREVSLSVLCLVSFRALSLVTSPRSLITESTKAFLFFPLLYYDPCLAYSSVVAGPGNPGLLRGTTTGCLFQLRGPFTAGRRGKLLYFLLPCRQGGEVTAWCDLFCDVCSQGLRLAVV